MANKKTKSNRTSKWKPVKISGNIAGDDLEGFAGLEVLENYDSSFLSGDIKKRNRLYLNNELDGDIYESRKRKRGDDDEEKGSGDENEADDKEIDSKELASDEELPQKPAKKKKSNLKKDVNSFPGKFVLLKPSQEDKDLFSKPENSEIRSAWDEINVDSDEIIKALVELNFKGPTDIQRLTIPVSCYGKCDILGAAQTGSGKTLAFGIPIVQCIQRRLKEHEEEASNFFALILTPTREVIFLRLIILNSRSFKFNPEILY